MTNLYNILLSLDAHLVLKEEICEVLKKHMVAWQPLSIVTFDQGNSFQTNTSSTWENTYDCISCFLCMDKKFHKKPIQSELSCLNYNSWQNYWRTILNYKGSYGTMMCLLGYGSQNPSWISCEHRPNWNTHCSYRWWH